MPTETLLTVRDVVQLLSVPAGTVKYWVRTGRMSAIVLPGQAGIRVEYEALQEFLDHYRRKKQRP